jgi:hypothetical protein
MVMKSLAALAGDRAPSTQGLNRKVFLPRRRRMKSLRADDRRPHPQANFCIRK